MAFSNSGLILFLLIFSIPRKTNRPPSKAGIGRTFIIVKIAETQIKGSVDINR